MNKFIGVCTDSDSKLLARFDNNSGDWLVNYFKQMFLGRDIKIQVGLNRPIEGTIIFKSKNYSKIAQR